MNIIVEVDPQLRKERKQICKDMQWNVHGLAGRLTIRYKAHNQPQIAAHNGWKAN